MPAIHSPERPTTSNGHPSWLRGHFAITPPRLFPTPRNTIAFSIMLPLNSDTFAACEHRAEIAYNDLGRIMQSFAEDPEGTIEALIPLDGTLVGYELRRSNIDYEKYFESGWLREGVKGPKTRENSTAPRVTGSSRKSPPPPLNIVL